MILSELQNTMPKQTGILIFKNSIYYIYQNLTPFRKPLLEDVFFDIQVYIIQTTFLFLKNIQKVKKILSRTWIYFSKRLAVFLPKTLCCNFAA